MSLSIGIVGLPNVGKSTLFNALTKKQAPAANYPFCTIEPNVGIVEVPDERLAKLAAMSLSARLVPTIIKFVDIAGLVKGASEGAGLGNKFLAHIRDCDAICEVVRDFADKNIIHVNDKVDPDDDRVTINLELILADLAVVEKRLAKVASEAKTGNKDLLAVKDLLTRLVQHLSNNQPARVFDLTADEKLLIADLNLITTKPLIYILNVDEAGNSATKNWPDGKVIAINAQLEAEIAALPTEEQAEFLQGLGLAESGLDKLIRAGYELLNLISFLTTGKDESRAWTIQWGTLAREAAGVIHTDFIKGFIRAEVINWQDLLTANSEAKARQLGLIRTEGKEYVVRDGDVCNFLINQ